MPSHWMHPDIPFFDLGVRAVVVYLAVLILLRIAGKRQMGQMGATEFVAILLISNAVQNSMNGGDNSLAGGVVLAAVLILLSALISYLTYRSKFISTIFEGTPVLVVHNGKILKKNLHREWISEDELKSLLRRQGISSCHDIQSAILEADGALTISKAPPPPLNEPMMLGESD